jgi:hypothetical protein
MFHGPTDTSSEKGERTLKVYAVVTYRLPEKRSEVASKNTFDILTRFHDAAG